MPRRWIETSVAVVAVIALGLVLYNATLVDRRPPALSRISLSATADDDDHVAQTLTAIDLAFSEPVDRASVEQRFRIEPYVSGTFTWDRNTTAIFTPAKKLPSATDFTVVVGAGFADAAGNLAPGSSGPFQFRTVGPPVVASMDPEAGSTGVATDAVVQLEFDRLMDTGSVEAALTVEPVTPIRVTWSGPSLTIAFRASLAFATTYTLTVGGEAADTDGSHLVTPFRAAFTTVAAGLGVDAVVPADGVAGIGVRSPIAIMFDGPIDPTSVDGAIRITPAIGGEVRVAGPASDVPAPPPSAGQSGSPTPAPPGPAGAGTILLFTPSEPLAEHTTYTVELVPVVRRAGEPGQVAAGRTWRFTTGGRTASVQNQIAFLSARGGVRNVWLMNPDGTNPRQITTELTPVSAYDVSSDGRALVYATAGLVRSLRLDGGDATTLTEDGLLEYAPTISPGAGAVLVGRRDASGADLGWWLEPLPGAAGGGDRQVLPTGAPPTGSVTLGGDGLVVGPGVSPWAGRAAFDPTGRWLLFVLPDGRVVHADLAPTAPEPSVELLDLTAPTGVPAWEAAHGGFVVTGSAKAGNGLLRINANGGGDTLIFPATGPVAVAGHGGITTLVAPNGDHIGYAALAAGPPEALTSAPDLLDRAPGFSPDGTTLVFGRVLAGDRTRSAGIWLCGLDGRDLRQLSTDGGAARWLP
jgi:hypothetical protein